MKCLEQIASLRQAIECGKLEPGKKVGTEFAFSRQWGLARNTVRRGVDTLINDGLLERRPGQGLFVRSPHIATRTVQVVVPNLAWNHVRRVARGAQQMGAQLGVHTQIYDAHGQMELDLEVLRRLPDGPTAGAIISSLHHRKFSEVLFELKSRAYPFVLVDQRLHDLEVATVEIRNYDGGYHVGKKLASLGHRRVAFLGPMNLHVITERLNGFRDAMLDASILFDRSLVIDLGGEGLTDWLNQQLEDKEESIRKTLSSDNPPTAVFDGSGDLAPIIYRAIQKLGLRIPRDVSVVTFDDAATFSQFLTPQVAQLEHPWEEVGRTALEILLAEMSRTSSKSKSEPREHRTVDFEWVEGESLAPVAEATQLLSPRGISPDVEQG